MPFWDRRDDAWLAACIRGMRHHSGGMRHSSHAHVDLVIAVAGGAAVDRARPSGRHRRPAAAERSAVSRGGCPENDTVPYSAACLEFINVPTEAAPRLQVVAVHDAAAGAVPGQRPGALQRELHRVPEGCHRNRDALAGDGRSRRPYPRRNSLVQRAPSARWKSPARHATFGAKPAASKGREPREVPDENPWSAHGLACRLWRSA